MADKSMTIPCKQCGYANEGERVYCHNCGSKLDRSLMPADDTNNETLKQKQKRIRKIVVPSRGFFVGFGKSLFYSVAGAALVASLVQIARKPDGVPTKIKKEDLLDVRPIALDLEDATQSPLPRRVILTEAEINGYLQYSIKSKSTGLIGDEVKFVRAFVNLDEGVIRIGSEQSLFDYPVFGSSYYKLAIKDKKVVATNVGGNFGRLKIHPQAMMYAQSVFEMLWGALRREKKLIDQFHSIEIHKGHIDLVSNAAPR